MIKLEVEPYCENCLIFDADVDNAKKAYCFDDVYTVTDTIIRCSRRGTCAGIKRYLEKEMQKGEN